MRGTNVQNASYPRGETTAPETMRRIHTWSRWGHTGMSIGNVEHTLALVCVHSGEVCTFDFSHLADAEDALEGLVQVLLVSVPVAGGVLAHLKPTGWFFTRSPSQTFIVSSEVIDSIACIGLTKPVYHNIARRVLR
eukprot:4226537-Pyramimonas_sp.AAC.2